MKEILIGVDEAGRGPLAGPVSVGIVSVARKFDIRKAFPGVGDSKALTEKKREEIYENALLYKERGEIDFCVEFGSAELIDTLGITNVVKDCVSKGVKKLGPKSQGVHVTEAVISLASIVAKVSRDRLMCTLAMQFPEYGFEKHKGYGTKAHILAIQEFGLSQIHRRTYCRSLSF